MAENNQRIPKTSEAVRKAILRKSAYSLPNTPSDLGYTAEQIRRTLYKGFIDNENSVLSELDRVVDAANDAFAADDEKITEESSARANADAALEGQITAEAGARASADSALDQKIAGCVEKADVSNILYGRDGSGECNYSVSVNADSNSVVKRTSRGDALVSFSATDDRAAINKAYADGRYTKRTDLRLVHDETNKTLRIRTYMSIFVSTSIDTS